MRFIWPLDDHYITRGFDFVSDIYVMGDNGVRMHAAVDLVRLQGDTAGREVKAVAMGVVVGDAWDKYSGYYIVLEHDGGWRTTYRHLVTDAPPVVGQAIMQGQVIGNVGSTGLSTGPHLHLDLWHRQQQDPTAHAKVGWWAHDPELYLGQEDEMLTQEEREWLSTIHHFAKLAGPVALDSILAKANHNHHHLHVLLPDLIAKAIVALPGGDGLDFGETVKAVKRAMKEGSG